jgi:hypothetical protein
VGALKYTAKGLSSARTSNEGVRVVLAPRNAGSPDSVKVYLPLIVR